MKMITRHVGFIPGPVNVGVIRTDKQAILVDTGLDDQSAKKIIAAMNEAKLEIIGILNTHAHADHYGGNARIRNSFKSMQFIYAPAIEEAVIRHPILEPVYLFGANPIAQLRGKFLMGKSSPAEPLPSPSLPFDDLSIQAISLPGHSINQVGYVCENVFFCADAIFPEGIIEKYGLLYCFDVASQLNTLRSLKNPLPYKMIVPSHAHPRQNISSLVEKNISHMEEITSAILDLISVPKTSEAITKLLCIHQKIPMKSIWQYYLHLNTVKAYLAALLKEEKVSAFVENASLVWVRK